MAVTLHPLARTTPRTRAELQAEDILKAPTLLGVVPAHARTELLGISCTKIPYDA